MSGSYSATANISFSGCLRTDVTTTSTGVRKGLSFLVVLVFCNQTTDRRFERRHGHHVDTGSGRDRASNCLS
ncbi:hypothetical protein Y1Q_0000510 [Alligator mississippiensis]|uniref:Uncharacterized protein n=1 Tax=Alligator mississippiensis TaxID=8496 RepID=A0A151MBD3_ALLMI|nr:hypothetical protein Y1Q_0000510 [Alligator mississippiensis]